MRFNGTEITAETVAAARQWYAEHFDTLAAEAPTFLASHYPLEQYRADMTDKKRAALAGEYDRSLAFMQRAYFIQTGESVALLP